MPEKVDEFRASVIRILQTVIGFLIGVAIVMTGGAIWDIRGNQIEFRTMQQVIITQLEQLERKVDRLHDDTRAPKTANAD